MRWPWSKKSDDLTIETADLDRRQDREIAHARAHLEDLKSRAFPAADYLDRRRERNHFTEVWQQIIGQDPRETHG